jgi:hypothetical protein
MEGCGGVWSFEEILLTQARNDLRNMDNSLEYAPKISLMILNPELMTTSGGLGAMNLCSRTFLPDLMKFTPIEL